MEKQSEILDEFVCYLFMYMMRVPSPRIEDVKLFAANWAIDNNLRLSRSSSG